MLLCHVVRHGLQPGTPAEPSVKTPTWPASTALPRILLLPICLMAQLSRPGQDSVTVVSFLVGYYRITFFPYSGPLDFFGSSFSTAHDSCFSCRGRKLRGSRILIIKQLRSRQIARLNGPVLTSQPYYPQSPVLRSIAPNRGGKCDTFL